MENEGKRPTNTSTETEPSRPQGRRQQKVHTLFNPPATAASETMAPWRVRLHDIIYEADTPAGHFFDVALLWAIVVSVAAVMLESVQSINEHYGSTLRTVEWCVTVLFTIEYMLRLVCVRRPFGYARSFFGVIDLLSVLPTYLSLFFAGTQVLAVVRVLRVLRVFRLFKLSQFVGEAEFLIQSLVASTRKILIFIGSVVTLVIIVGAIMYWVEGAEAGFTSIPRSMYWAVVTLTTVGYGDIAPKSALGQAIAATVMVLGYAIIAVPTGIVSAEMARRGRAAREVTTLTCPSCVAQGHDHDAKHCKFCGDKLLT